MRIYKRLLWLTPLFVLASCNEAEVASVEQPRTVLSMVVGERTANTTSRFAGELRAIDRAVLSFEAGGVVTNLNVNLGDQFKPGQILGRVDDTRARLTLESRRAELLDAEAAVQEAQLEFDRRSSLSGTGAVSVASIEQAETRLESSKARLSVTQAGVASAEKQISDTFMKAPFAGEVVNRLVEPSQVVNLGQPILEVVGLDAGLEGIVTVPDHVRQAMALEEDASIRILALNTQIAASVTEIGNRANAAGLFPITLQLQTEPDNASAGQSIEVTFGGVRPTGSEGGLIIPVTAYTVDASGQAYVFLIDDASSDTSAATRRQPVELGEITGDGVVIKSGIRPGMVIVTKGVDLLSDGQDVISVGQNSQRFGN